MAEDTTNQQPFIINLLLVITTIFLRILLNIVFEWGEHPSRKHLLCRTLPRRTIRQRICYFPLHRKYHLWKRKKRHRFKKRGFRSFLKCGGLAPPLNWHRNQTRLHEAQQNLLLWYMIAFKIFKLFAWVEDAARCSIWKFRSWGGQILSIFMRPTTGYIKFCIAYAANQSDGILDTTFDTDSFIIGVDSGLACLCHDVRAQGLLRGPDPVGCLRQMQGH